MRDAPNRYGPVPKGERRSRTIRLPETLDEVCRHRAAELGLHVTSYIALALAEHEKLAVPGYVADELAAARSARAREELDMLRSA